MKSIIEIKPDDEACCLKVCEGSHVHYKILLIYGVNIGLVDEIEHIIAMRNEAHKLLAVIDLHAIITWNKGHPILGVP